MTRSDNATSRPRGWMMLILISGCNPPFEKPWSGSHSPSLSRKSHLLLTIITDFQLLLPFCGQDARSSTRMPQKLQRRQVSSDFPFRFRPPFSARPSGTPPPRSPPTTTPPRSLSHCLISRRSAARKLTVLPFHLYMCPQTHVPVRRARDKIVKGT